VSLETRDLLDFQRCHAQARDAVHSRLEAAALAATLAKITGAEVLRLHSAAPDRATYLQRPDLGRNSTNPAASCLHACVNRPAQSLSPSSSPTASPPWPSNAMRRRSSRSCSRASRLATRALCVVEQARVAIGDEIGLALGAQISVVLIGERPGLSSPDSLGAYITWDPRPGRTDAERNCISNIRAEGLSYAQAAADKMISLFLGWRGRCLALRRMYLLPLAILVKSASSASFVKLLALSNSALASSFLSQCPVQPSEAPMHVHIVWKASIFRARVSSRNASSLCPASVSAIPRSRCAKVKRRIQLESSASSRWSLPHRY
jgi:ethanolamine ammonia-lyase small subunit